MNIEEIKKGVEGDLNEARAIAQMFSSRGWKIYDKLKKAKIKALKNIETCNLNNLEARKKAIKILEDLDNELEGIVNQADESLKIKEKLGENN